MIINFKTVKLIELGAYKLIQTSTLIIIIKKVMMYHKFQDY